MHKQQFEVLESGVTVKVYNVLKLQYAAFGNVLISIRPKMSSYSSVDLQLQHCWGNSYPVIPECEFSELEGVNFKKKKQNKTKHKS